jgi:hypothetical protein
VTRSGATPVTVLVDRKNALAGSQIAVLAQHDVDQGAVAVDRPIQIPPLTTHSDVRFIDIPAAAHSALAFATEVLRQSRRQLCLPLPHRLLGEDEPAGQKHLRQVAQAQLVAQATEHNEGNDVARVLCLIQHVSAAFIELLAAAAAEPAVALCRPLWSFADRGRSTCRTAHLASLPLGVTTDRTWRESWQNPSIDRVPPDCRYNGNSLDHR